MRIVLLAVKVQWDYGPVLSNAGFEGYLCVFSDEQVSRTVAIVWGWVLYYLSQFSFQLLVLQLEVQLREIEFFQDLVRGALLKIVWVILRISSVTEMTEPSREGVYAS